MTGLGHEQGMKALYFTSGLGFFSSTCSQAEGYGRAEGVLTPAVGRRLLGERQTCDF